MQLGQIRVLWTGGPSAPGYTILNTIWGTSSSAVAAQAAVRKFFDTIKGSIPDDYTLQVQQEMTIINASTGKLEQLEMASSAQAPIVGLMGQGWAAGVGVRVDWQGGGVLNGRRIRGRTYIVPYNASVFDASGQVPASVRTSLGGYATTMITDLAAANTPLCVWNRPSVKNPVGGASVVQSAAVSSKAAVLRGRRD